jgi:hypothetical protein
MPFFEKNIKILVKKRLEDKSCVLTPQVYIYFAKLFSTSQNAVFSQKHQDFGQKMLGRRKLRFDPLSLNPFCKNV